MRCRQCQHENRDERRFCSACGAVLEEPCGSCGFANQPGEQFCGGCGLELAGGASHPGERRQVAVVFADLSGYTTLSSRLDPEETHRLLQRFFDVVDGVVMRFGGTVDKHIGDNVMGLFGAPVAHHDDCERAVRAAAEIHRGVTELSPELGVALRVHVGIAVGEVMASGTGSRHHRQYTVIGSSVNLAGRLQEMARPGETLVSDDVRRATATVAEFESLGSIQVKGLERPVPTWRFARMRATRARGERPLVGRRDELAAMSVLLERAASGGGGAWVHLRGEAGLGKTRLVDAIEEVAGGRGFRSCAGQVLDFGAARGAGAIDALVEELLDLRAHSTAEDRRSAVGRFVAARPALAARAAFLHDLLGLAPPEDARATYESMQDDARTRGRRDALAALVEAVAAERPLLLAVDDLHWADPATLEQVVVIADVLAHISAVLITTSRVEDDPLAGRMAPARGPDAVWQLAPLSAEESAFLAGQIAPDLGAAVHRSVVRAGGNPLFLEQLLLAGGASADAAIPGTVQSLILARMDRLPPADRAALQAASVAGQRFTLELVRRLTSSAEYEAGVLVAQGLVEPDGASYRFHHALVQDGVYSSLTVPRRRELHRAAAAYHAATDPVLRARHLDRAEDAGAPQSYLDAAVVRAAAYDVQGAAALLDRGLALAREASDVYRVAMALGDRRGRVGEGGRSRDAYARALDAAATDVELCRALIGMASAHRLLSGYQAALGFLREAEPIAGQHGLDLELAQIHYYRGAVLFALADAEGCLREHGAALVHAERTGRVEWRARALSGLGDAAFANGDLVAAGRSYLGAAHMCDAHGLERFAAINRIMQANCVAQARMEFREARALIESGVATCKRLGDEATHAIALTVRAFLDDLQGRNDELATDAAQALAELRRLSITRFEPEALALLALARHRAGAGRQAIALAREAVAVARQSGMDFCGPMVLAALSQVADSPEERADALREGELILRGNGMASNHLSFAGRALEGALERGDTALAERHAERLAAAIACYGDLAYWSFIVRRARHRAGAPDTAERAEIERMARDHDIDLPVG